MSLGPQPVGRFYRHFFPMLSFNLTGYYTLMNDEVNNPTHYNQNGIEVIDVIETYAKGDFRLANVIKYVCRCEYKGRKLQDLQKAAWYLDRVIEELQYEEWKGIDRGVSDWTLDDIEPPTPEDVVVTLREGAGELLEEPHGYTDRECEVFWDGYRCKEQELDEEHDATLVHPSPDRIAGDNEAAQRIKADYYGFDRYEIKGHCANCAKPIGVTQPHVTGGGFSDGIFFCKPECLNRLREWQGR